MSDLDDPPRRTDTGGMSPELRQAAIAAYALARPRADQYEDIRNWEFEMDEHFRADAAHEVHGLIVYDEWKAVIVFDEGCLEGGQDSEDPPLEFV